MTFLLLLHPFVALAGTSAPWRSAGSWVPAAAAAMLGDITLSGVDIGLAILALVVMLIGYHFVFVRYIRQAAGVGDEPQPTEIIGQPVMIKAEVEFVRVQDFNAKFAEISHRFLGIEAQIKDQVTKTDKYLHEMRHEVKGEFAAIHLALEESRQIAQSSVSKAHARVDRISETVAESRGKLTEVANGVAEIRTLLLNRRGGEE